MDWKKEMAATAFAAAGGPLAGLAAREALNQKNPSTQTQTVLTTFAAATGGPLAALAAQQLFKR